MKYYLLIIMAFQPGEKIDHFLLDRVAFDTAEECRSFGTQYSEMITNLAVMKFKGKDWSSMYCIPENNANSELIESILNEKGI